MEGASPSWPPSASPSRPAVLWSFSRTPPPVRLPLRRDEPCLPRIFAAIGQRWGEQNQSKMPIYRLLGKLLIMGGRAMVQAYAKPSSGSTVVVCRLLLGRIAMVGEFCNSSKMTEYLAYKCLMQKEWSTCQRSGSVGRITGQRWRGGGAEGMFVRTKRYRFLGANWWD